MTIILGRYLLIGVNCARTYYRIRMSMYAMITMEIVCGIGGNVFAVFVLIVMVEFSILEYGHKKNRTNAGIIFFSYLIKHSFYVIVNQL